MTKSTKATIIDVAKHFGCSITTVSRAINGAPDINPDTRRKILQYAEEIGFVSRRSATSKGKFAVIRADSSESFNAIVDAFCVAAEKQHFEVINFVADMDLDLQTLYAEYKLKGAFVIGIKANSPLYRQLNNLRQPIVLLNGHVPCNEYISNVRSNDIFAIAEAIDFLVSLGHDRIAFVGSNNNPLSLAECLAGYTFGLEKNSIPYRYDLTASEENSYKGGASAAESLVAYNRYFTAAICTSESMAQGFADYLAKVGKTIPQDMSLIVMTDTIADDECKFTSIAIDSTELGYKAFDALLQTVKGYGAQEPTVQYALICKHRSCGPKSN